MPRPLVEIDGLKELRRDLRKMQDKELLGRLRDTNQRVGSVVVRSAQAHADTPLQRRAAETLTASRSERAAVRFGRGFAAAMGAEFGAAQDRPRTRSTGNFVGYRQFDEWRGSGASAGYFLWPAIRDESPRIVDMYADELAKRFGAGNV